MAPPKILVVHRRSSYTDFVSSRRHPRITELIKDEDPLIESIVKAHENHTEAMQGVKQALLDRKLCVTWRHHIDDINPDDFDLVITVGGDGTVLHASHAIGATPVLAVNSSPATSVGFFTSTDATGFGKRLDEVLNKATRPITLSRMKVEVNDKVVTDRALNDCLFCHDCPASTTRYVLSYNSGHEDQLSSGVWVSTAAGSTAAIRAAGGQTMRPRSKRLQFAVREPFPSGGAMDQVTPTMVNGFISDEDTFTLRSRTHAARLYLDGPHLVFPVEFGDTVSFARSGTPLHLYGIMTKEE